MAVDANLEVFADYFQVYLADPLLEDDWSDAWQAQSVDVACGCDMKKPVSGIGDLYQCIDLACDLSWLGD